MGRTTRLGGRRGSMRRSMQSASTPATNKREHSVSHEKFCGAQTSSTPHGDPVLG